MSRRLPTVVAITGLSSLACGAGDVVPPELPTEPLPADLVPYTEPLSDGSADAFQTTRTLNPRHPEHGEITVAAGTPAYCQVIVPTSKPPSSWQPPTTKRVDCPASMHDAAWLECRNGTIATDDAGERCVCFVDGNPPPPAAWVHCPEQR